MGNGEFILVVDDIAEHGTLPTDCLKDWGIRFIWFPGERGGGVSEEPYGRSRALGHDHGPGMDGLESYQRILEIHPRQKAILVTVFQRRSGSRRPRNWGRYICQ